jgi:hypothetical protein
MSALIQPGSPVLLRDQSLNIRLIQSLNPSTTYRVGRVQIKGGELVNRAYGETLSQTDESRWIRVQPTIVGDDVANEEAAEMGITSEASLTSAITSSTFSQKTKFSQEKYLRKKHAKYAKELTLLFPSVRLLGDSNLRWDMLGLIARHASVTSGTACVVYEAETAGIVSAHLANLGAVIFRIIGNRGANSNVAMISAHAEVAPQQHKKNTSVRLQNSSEFVPEISCEVSVFIAVDAANPGSTDGEEWRKAVEAGVVKLSSAGGRFVAFVKDFERAIEVQKKMRSGGNGVGWVNVTMQEVLLREHQVLENRTHPIMTAVLKMFDGWVVAGLKVKKIN